MKTLFAKILYIFTYVILIIPTYLFVVFNNLKSLEIAKIDNTINNIKSTYINFSSNSLGTSFWLSELFFKLLFLTIALLFVVCIFRKTNKKKSWKLSIVVLLFETLPVLKFIIIVPSIIHLIIIYNIITYKKETLQVN